MKYIALVALFLFTLSANAGDIAFGTIKSIKHYHLTNYKHIKVYFNTDAQKQNQSCIEKDDMVVGTINLSTNDPDTANRMLGIALSAYMGNKKIRMYSEGDDCEAEFISIQETYF